MKGKQKMGFSNQEEELETMGWRVITLWECELNKNSFEDTLNRLEQQLHNDIQI